MKLFTRLVFVFLLTSHCVKLRTEVTELDVQRILDRLAFLRFSQRVELEDLDSIKSDEELFVEICELNRLPPKLVLEKLKNTNPNLYKHLGKKYEQ